MEYLEESLSASGRTDATVNIYHTTSEERVSDHHGAEPVLEVDVAHVFAHEKQDDDAAHMEMDDEDVQDGEDDGAEPHETESYSLLRDPEFKT